MMKIIKQIVLGVLALCLTLAPAAGARAADRLATALFPTLEALQGHGFFKNPVLVQVKKGLEPERQFEIPIPSAKWKRLKREKLKGGGERLAGFVHPQGPKTGMIQVIEFPMVAEVGPQDWLLWVCQRSGLRPMMVAGQGSGAEGPFFEVLAVTETPKGATADPLVMRAGVFRSGKRLILVKCTALAPAFLDLAYHFGLATNRFRLAHPEPMTLVGKWRRRCLGGFCYTGPAVEPDKIPHPGQPMQEELFRLALDGKRTGMLSVKMVGAPLAAQTEAQMRITVLLASLAKNRGLKFPGEVTALKGEHMNLGGTAYYARAEGTGADGSPISLFALSWEGKDQAVIVWMLSDAPKKNHPAWMVNKRTFEVISDSLARQPQDKQ